MKEKITEKIIIAIVVIAMSVNAFMLIHTWMLMNTNATLRENKASYILPDGFTPEKTKVTSNAPLPSGWAVRYASSGCIYCKLDFEWENLASQLERRNYRIITILPNASSQFDKDQIIPKNAWQMAYVKMDWIKQFRFLGTPTVIIFDSKGHVLWQCTGMMSSSDYEAAAKAIIKNKSSS